MAAPDLVRRNAALAKTMRRYRGEPLVWGKADCVVMLRSHLLAMGHRNLPKLPEYATPAEARRALKAAGFDDLKQLLDSLLPRIAPAMALPGDVVLLAGEGGMGSIGVSTGFKLFGWHEDAAGAEILIARQTEGAWRG